MDRLDGGVVHFREPHNGSVRIPFTLCEGWDLFMKFLMGTKDVHSSLRILGLVKRHLVKLGYLSYLCSQV